MESVEIVQLFPDPPPFYKSDSVESLQPPPIPLQEKKSSVTPFGQPLEVPALDQVQPPENDFNLPSEDPVECLKQLHKRHLYPTYFQILEQLQTMTTDNASQVQDTVQRLEMVLLLMNYYLNQLRPYQARQSLLLMSQKQLEQVRSRLVPIRERCREIQETLKKTMEEKEEALARTEITHDESLFLATPAVIQAKTNPWADLEKQILSGST